MVAVGAVGAVGAMTGSEIKVVLLFVSPGSWPLFRLALDVTLSNSTSTIDLIREMGVFGLASRSTK